MTPSQFVEKYSYFFLAIWSAAGSKAELSIRSEEGDGKTNVFVSGDQHLQWSGLATQIGAVARQFGFTVSSSEDLRLSLPLVISGEASDSAPDIRRAALVAGIRLEFGRMEAFNDLLTYQRFEGVDLREADLTNVRVDQTGTGRFAADIRGARMGGNVFSLARVLDLERSTLGQEEVEAFLQAILERDSWGELALLVRNPAFTLEQFIRMWTAVTDPWVRSRILTSPLLPVEMAIGLFRDLPHSKEDSFSELLSVGDWVEQVMACNPSQALRLALAKHAIASAPEAWRGLSPFSIPVVAEDEEDDEDEGEEIARLQIGRGQSDFPLDAFDNTSEGWRSSSSSTSYFLLVRLNEQDEVRGQVIAFREGEYGERYSEAVVGVPDAAVLAKVFSGKLEYLVAKRIAIQEEKIERLQEESIRRLADAQVVLQRLQALAKPSQD